MTEGASSRPVRIPTWSDADVPGDLVPAWDLFLEGEADYEDLPVSDQRGARLLLADEAGAARGGRGIVTDVTACAPEVEA